MQKNPELREKCEYLERKKMKLERSINCTCQELLLWSEILLACHKGGPMGFADNDPGAFSLDVSSSPTYIAASTVGTAGCKNWDYARQQQLHYIQDQWSVIGEDASRGSGENLTALAQIMGCNKSDQLDFGIMVHHHYSFLFQKTDPDIEFFTEA